MPMPRGGRRNRGLARNGAWAASRCKAHSSHATPREASAELEGKMEGWSQRRLAAQIAIPATTLRRLRDQKGNPLVWFPRIQSAMHRLNPS